MLDMGIDAAEGAVSMLAPGEWRGLIAALDRLSASLKALKTPTPPANPAAPTASRAARRTPGRAACTASRPAPAPRRARSQRPPPPAPPFLKDNDHG